MRYPNENGIASVGVDESALTSIITNGEDVGPLIRSAFQMGKPDHLSHQLRGFVKKKEVEIEELCKVHYEEFILAVDELRNVLSDAYALKHGLFEQDKELQSVGSDLLMRLEDLIEANQVKQNLTEAIESLQRCKTVIELCARVNQWLLVDRYYPALKTLDIIERDHLKDVPGRRLREYLERQIPICRTHIEQRVNKEFNEWLADIRGVAKEIGRLSIAQATSARQREEDLRARQRQAEEQSRSGQRDMVYMLEVEDNEEDDVSYKFNLTSVYRAHHINTCLGLQEQFKEYYFKNRQLQLSADLQFQAQSFLENYQSYFAQIAGFFIIEDRVLRTAGGVITAAQLDSLWEMAIQKMKMVMEDQFSRMQVATTLLLVKDYVSLLSATLKRHGYQVAPLLDVIDSTREKYHELLLTDCRRQISDVLANDKYEQMVMRREYEYGMNVLAFHLQSSDIMPAFPYIAPFSATVPECCRIVRGFIEDSVNFLAYGGLMDHYEIVKRYVDKLLVGVLNEALLRVIKNPSLTAPHAMQLAANMTVLERACAFFAEHAAKLCGVPSRLIDGPYGTLSARAVLRNSQAVAHEQMITVVKHQIDLMMGMTDNINWMPDEPAQTTSDYVQDLLIYLETMLDTASDILPVSAFEVVSRGIMGHISACIATTLTNDEVKKFNIYAIMQIDTDLRVLESFADERFKSSGLDRIPEAVPLRQSFLEARQMVNLMLSNQPDLYLSPAVRERNYSLLPFQKVIILCDKFREASDRGSQVFRGRGGFSQKEKKKSLESLSRRLREAIADERSGRRNSTYVTSYSEA